MSLYGPNPLVWPAEGGATGNISLIVSFKRRPIDVLNGIHDAEISAWLAKLPTTRRTWIAYEHEMDVKVQRHEYELEDVRNAFIRITKLIRAAKNPRLRATMILTGYRYAERLPLYWPGSENVDVLAVDTYQWDAETVESMITTNLAVARQYKKPFGLSEFGLWKGSDAERAARITEAIQRAHNNYTFVAYFDADRTDVESDHDWEISDLPLSSAAWRDAIAATR